MKIDFVSDVACPWCAIGLSALETALERTGMRDQVQLHFQPFELNPAMVPAGEDSQEHLARKYGLGPQQLAQGKETLRQRGAAVGFTFGDRKRIWNTFDAHRLLHWAGLTENGPEKQRALKHALLAAYHTRGENPGDTEVLVRAASEAGLDPVRAREILSDDTYALDVRASERHFQELGIKAVPAVIINDRHLIQGGQPPEAFEQALRELAAQEEN